jgi:hypothetical protein
MDEVHSMLSREKGLAGMAENVRRGHRAGGRAPIGYRLERIETGAIRDGAPSRNRSSSRRPGAGDRALPQRPRRRRAASALARELRPAARGRA